MAEANRFCNNCGTPLVTRDGKIVCPNCGTEYAVDWGKEDVERARIETEQERARAQFDRERTISQTREQISRQQEYDSQKREIRREQLGVEKRMVWIVSLICMFFVIVIGLRACLFAATFNVKNLESLESTEQTEGDILIQIDEQMLLENEEFLKMEYASLIYALTYNVDREIVPDGTDTKLIYTGNYEYAGGYLVYPVNGRSELLQIFAMEYAPENGGEPVTIYIPIFVAMTGTRADGTIRSSNDPLWYRGSQGQKGFRDRDLIIDAYVKTRENVDGVVPFEVPEKIRSEVQAIYAEEGRT